MSSAAFGDPRLPAMFWAKVRYNSASGCWEWVGALPKDGYGRYSATGSQRLAHRVSYTALVEPIAAGLVIDHLCRVRRCVNPSHLRAVSSRENTMAEGSLSEAKLRSARVRCPRGHSLTDRRVLIPARLLQGHRVCRPCQNALSAAYHSRVEKGVIWTEEQVKAYADRRYAELIMPDNAQEEAA